MLTGELRSNIDKLWEKFWTGGITNPLTVIEQISYLIFARMLDMQEEIEERKAIRTGKTIDRIFPDTPRGQKLRWKNFKHESGKNLYQQLKNYVYPYFQYLGWQHNIELCERLQKEQPDLFTDLSGEIVLQALKNKLSQPSLKRQRWFHISEYMQDADLAIKNESVLASAVEMVEQLPLGQSDVKGDLYEYLLSKLTTAGINGQFRTPRHIIDCMIELVDPQPEEIICDPACGTAGFLARTMEYLNKEYSSSDGTITDEEGNRYYTGDLLEPYQEHIQNHMFWGFDFDTTMLRVSSMNMLLHGVSGAHILYQDSLNKSIKENYPVQEKDFFNVILANPPFKGSLDEANTNPDVLAIVKTKKTELLFVAHILRALVLGGRAAVIVPDGVLFGSSNAHRQLRKELIENNQLEGIVSLPSGVFKPYAGVSTAILLLTKGGSTERVWFFDVQADGYSLDDKRTPRGENDLPDVVQQWRVYSQLVKSNASEQEIMKAFGDKTQKAFVVLAQDIIENKYDLSINRYKEIVYEEEQYEDPKVILKKLKALEKEIMVGLEELERML